MRLYPARGLLLTISWSVFAAGLACGGSGEDVPSPAAAAPTSSVAGASTTPPDRSPVRATTSTGAPAPGPDREAGIPIDSTPPVASQSASAVAVTPDGHLIVAVNPDSDSVTVVDATSLLAVAEVGVGNDPRTLAITPNGRHALVANHAGGSVSAVDLTAFIEVARWAVGPMPYGVVTDGVTAYVTGFASAGLWAIDMATGRVSRTLAIGEFPAGIAMSANGTRLFVSHLFDGSLSVVDVPQFRLEARVSTGADTNISQFVALDPGGSRAYLPQTRSNVGNTALLFDTTVFPVVNAVEIDDLSLDRGARITLDTANRPVSLPFAMAITPDGRRAFVANAGTDDVSAIVLETGRGLGSIEVGANPRGIAISPDGARVYVNNVLDGTLSVIDTVAVSVVATVSTTAIPLEPDILLGKKIFNSAADPVLSTDGWIACATCHFDGGSDRRTWAGFPDGPRNTPALFGVAETLPVHWSGDLDELADVELTIRNIQAGAGLVAGEAFDSLGPPHSGLSADLDALAAYMATLDVASPPHETDPGAFAAGQRVFQTLGCGSCHVPGAFVDGEIHDVGTGDPALEKNSHGRGVSFDTPSLRGLWLTAPYFHDGSAPTLADVLRTGATHSVAETLTQDQIDDLVAYMLALPAKN